MEVDFDKEIDILLRKSARGAPVVANGGHLDADQISSFADNAVPAAFRSQYVGHFANCDRCRELLALAVSFDDETYVQVSAAAAVPLGSFERVPWYRKWVGLQPLAYTVGALVLLLSGFIGYTFLRQKGELSAGSDVSQVYETEQRPSGPNAMEEAPVSAATASNTATTSATNTLIAANSNTVRMQSNTSGTTGSNTVPAYPTPQESRPASVGGQPVAVPAGPPPPPPPAADSGVAESEKLKESVARQAPAQPEQNAARDEDKKISSTLRATNPAAKAAAQRRDAQAQLGATLDGTSATAANSKREVSGKTFEQRQGVWYDSGYRGQAITNVRRGTSEYIRLEAGLRSIADRINGTVVIVWSGKAYRIQ